MAREREWRCPHGGVQRAERRSPAVESLRGQAQQGVRRLHSRSSRSDPLAVREQAVAIGLGGFSPVKPKAAKGQSVGGRNIVMWFEADDERYKWLNDAMRVVVGFIAAFGAIPRPRV